MIVAALTIVAAIAALLALAAAVAGWVVVTRVAGGHIASHALGGTAPLGAPLKEWLSPPRGMRWRPGIYLLTAPACVGTYRVRPHLPSTARGHDVTWVWVVAPRERPPGGDLVVRAPSRFVRTPQALLIGPDRCVWRAQIVSSLSRWREFVDLCPCADQWPAVAWRPLLGRRRLAMSRQEGP